jgi:hypothetical protein
VAELKAEDARLKRSLTEKEQKNMKWCGTPMVDGDVKENSNGDIITPKQVKFWCGTVLQDKKSKNPKP